VLLALVAGELVARFVLGLGDPPLIMADPEIEYLFRPNQDCRRQGNRIRYNAYSMRSEDFPAKKTNPLEFRVMVVGDSVVNGGNPTDHARLATTIAGPLLSGRLHRPVTIGNISAGSWGPPNELAYLRRFGLFDADVLLIVISSHDAADVPQFDQPIIGPQKKPFSALAEGISRYSLGDLLQWAKGSAPTAQPDAAPVQATLPAADREQGLAALREMIRIARKAGAQVAILHHQDLHELQHEPAEGHGLIAGIAVQEGISFFELAPAFKKQLADGPSPFRDHIHPNDLGQKLLADAIVTAVVQLTANTGLPAEGGADR